MSTYEGGEFDRMHPRKRQRKNTALTWFKSSYSGSDGGQCLEVAYDWRKSSYSSEQGGACIEVASHPAAIHVRDSKNPEGPTFTVAPTAWSAFAAFAAQD